MSATAAMRVIRTRAASQRQRAQERWQAVVGSSDLDPWAERFRGAGRLTLNFHPDRVTRSGVTVARGLLDDGRYRSQWVTGVSAGSRSAVLGGDRQRFERELFAGAYDSPWPTADELPVYGALDLLADPHGGSPRFGSSFLVLRPHVADRTTLCVGDSHLHPIDVGTVDEPWSILAALAEQARRGALLNRRLGVGTLVEALDGRYRSPGPARDLDGYVEVQVHGGISLASDVTEFVLDPSFADTEVARDLRSAADRYGFTLSWHHGSELHVDQVPNQFRGPTMPTLARAVARPDGILDAHAIGRRAATVPYVDASPVGDPHDADLQQLKYLWHTLLAHGHDHR